MYEHMSKHKFMTEDFLEKNEKEGSKQIFFNYFQSQQDRLENIFDNTKEVLAQVKGVEESELSSKEITPRLVEEIAVEMNRGDEQFKDDLAVFLKPKIWGCQKGDLSLSEQVFQSGDNKGVPGENKGKRSDLQEMGRRWKESGASSIDDSLPPGDR